MNEIDEILKTALSPSKYPSEQLNEKINNRMKESGKMKRINRNLAIAAAIILGLLIVPASAYAAYRYLLPKEAAVIMEDEKLGKAFEEKGENVLETVSDGAYKVTYLGKVSGESISERTGSAWELHPERTYIAVAVEKIDQTAMTYEDNLFISPLIQGLQPWNYNIASMNGSYMEKFIDGVLYRIIECDNIEIFADKKLYLAVSDTVFFSKDAFSYDEETGLISENLAYEGTNVLFPIELDASKADPAKVKEYLEQLEKEWNPEPASEGSAEEKQETNPRIQQETFIDDENKLTFRIPDYNDYAEWGGSSWWSGEEYSEMVLRFRFMVEGDGIDSLTYTLNRSELGYFPRNKREEWKTYDTPYTISYDDQEGIDYTYQLKFKAGFTDYGYDKEYIAGLGVKDIEERDKIQYNVLNEEIAATALNLDIRMKDGRTVTKTLTFQNVLAEEENSSVWIAISVE